MNFIVSLIGGTNLLFFSFFQTLTAMGSLRPTKAFKWDGFNLLASLPPELLQMHICTRLDVRSYLSLR